MMEIPDTYDMTLDYSVVKTDAGYIVKVDIVMPEGRMHMMDLGPLETQEQAESLTEHIKSGDITP